MSPSVTYWHRIEPRSRSNSIINGLSAQIRDPFWMLARQWQLGELQGEDAGSPAYIELVTQVADLQAWQADNTIYALEGAPLEDLVESEGFTPDLALRVEIGQAFEMLLEQRSASVDIAAFRQKYPLLLLWQNIPPLFTTAEEIANNLDAGEIPEALQMAFTNVDITLSTATVVWTNVLGREWALTDRESGLDYIIGTNQDNEFVAYRLLDRETLPFLRLCAGRVIDGVALLLADQPMPTDLTMPDEASDALEELIRWYGDVVRPNNMADSPAWQPERLEYQADVFVRDAQSTSNGFLRLRARPERDGTFDWHTFDLVTSNTSPMVSNPRPVREETAYTQPNRLTFRGMPNVRWWEFENNLIDIGAIQPEKRDLSRLIMMDFMLVAGNDWFLIPYRQPVGSACWVDLLAVHDVFGGATRVKAAVPSATTKRSERWSMFTHSVAGKPNQIAPFFILPPTAGSAMQEGPKLEEVRFLRDEMANLVWAIEELTENAVGLPWPGRDYDNAAKPPITTPTTTQGLHYIVQSPMPSFWIPFDAVQQANGVAGRVKLQMLDLLDEQVHSPRGRVLQPSSVTGIYSLWEEDVPREGTRVLRVVLRSRWLGGETHVWIARPKSIISERTTIALRFDQAVPSTPQA